MVKLLAVISSLAISFSAVTTAFAADSSEGTYSNGKVTIKIEVGARGGDEIISSLCKGKVLKPVLDADSEMLMAQDKSYAISFGAGYSHMEVEGTNKCIPEGRYKRVK